MVPLVMSTCVQTTRQKTVIYCISLSEAHHNVCVQPANINRDKASVNSLEILTRDTPPVYSSDIERAVTNAFVELKF